MCSETAFSQAVKRDNRKSIPAPDALGDYSASGFSAYKRLFAFVKPYKWQALLTLLLPIPIGALDGAIAFSLKPFVEGLGEKNHVVNLAFIPLLIVGFTLAQGLLNYASTYINGWLGFKVMSDLRRTLYEKLLRLDVGFFDKNSAAFIIQRFYKDPESVNLSILTNLRQLISRLTASVCLIGGMLYISWQLSLIAVGVLLLMLYPSTRVRALIKYWSREENRLSEKVISAYTEIVGGIRLIHGYNLASHKLDIFDRIQDVFFEKTLMSVRIRGWLTPIMHLIAACGIAIVIWQGSSMVASGGISQGGFVSFITALLMLYNPVKNLGNNIVSAQTAMTAANRIERLLELEPAIDETADAIPLTHFNDCIEFDRVTFGYTPDRLILSNLSFKVRKGEKVALVGLSGGGKTTIVSLLNRFYDVNEGAIRIDGRDIRDYTLESLHDSISVVMQDNFVFNDTIRRNVLLGDPTFRGKKFRFKNEKAKKRRKRQKADFFPDVAMTAEELSAEQGQDCKIWEALEKAYLKQFVESLDEQLWSKTGERGVLLSGGQRQRLAIARSLMKDSPIVILDEATSALDNHSEASVYRAMDCLMKDKTVIMIAHRLSSLRNADRILVIEGGRIVEEGGHDELLGRNGHYAALYMAQFSRKEAARLVEGIETTETWLLKEQLVSER